MVADSTTVDILDLVVRLAGQKRITRGVFLQVGALKNVMGLSHPCHTRHHFSNTSSLRPKSQSEVQRR